MWHVMAVIGYFVLALLIPIGFTAVGIWAKTRQARVVSCPQAGASAAIWLDPWFAMRKRAIGDPEAIVRHCSLWPAHGGCAQNCLRQIGERV